MYSRNSSSNVIRLFYSSICLEIIAHCYIEKRSNSIRVMFINFIAISTQPYTVFSMEDTLFIISS